MAQWKSAGFLACRGPAARRPSAVRWPATPSIPRQSRRHGHRQVVGKRDLEVVAAAEPEFRRLASDQIGVSGRPARSARLPALACSASEVAVPARGCCRASSGPSGGGAQSSHQFASVQPGNLRLPSGRCGPFFGVICPAVTPCPGAGQKGPFFCCGGVGPCYKPAARGIAAGYGCFSRGRGGTGRRAGFRFQ